MMRLCYASQSRAVLIGVLFCAVQAFAEAASATSAVGGTDESVVEVDLATAKPHALIQYGPEKIRALHAVGDMLFHPKDPTRFVEILEIGPAGAVIRDSATRRKRSSCHSKACALSWRNRFSAKRLIVPRLKSPSRPGLHSQQLGWPLTLNSLRTFVLMCLTRTRLSLTQMNSNR